MPSSSRARRVFLQDHYRGRDLLASVACTKIIPLSTWVGIYGKRRKGGDAAEAALPKVLPGDVLFSPELGLPEGLMRAEQGRLHGRSLSE